MRKPIWFYASFLLLILNVNTFAFDKGEELNVPPSPAARDLVKRAVLLAESDKPWAAIAAVKKAIYISPNYLRAHIEYRNIKANFLDKYAEVEAEYSALIKRFPNNPVYLMAVYYNAEIELGQASWQKVTQLAPEWAWGHYAKALLVHASDPEKAVIELQHCIEKDNSAIEAYNYLIYLQENRLNRIDDAIRTAEKLAAQTDIRANLRLQALWRLHLEKSQRSEEAKQNLRNDLLELANSTKEVDVLLAIRLTYLAVLKDSERARATERRITEIDPNWSTIRGRLHPVLEVNQSGIPRRVVLVNRQIVINDKTRGIVTAIDMGPAEKVRRLEALFRLNPSGAMRRIIYEKVFQLALRSGDTETARKYGKALSVIDPGDSALLAQIALILADNVKYLTEALNFARKAESLTSEFRPVKPALNMPPSFLNLVFPEQKQREVYQRNRALSLDALGWTLTRMGKAKQAEPLLRQAIGIERSESGLLHLAKALEQMGRMSEAATLEVEANTFLANRVRRKLINEQTGDLQLETIEGRSFKLSDLKGKVVVIHFWATWCVPCLRETPILKRLYEKYKNKGLEILAVSTDDDISKVRPFVTKHKFGFPVLNIPSLQDKLEIPGLPTNLFIDKQGNIRYRKAGFDESNEREFEVVIMELLK